MSFRLFLGALLVLSGFARGDEAVRRDGSRVSGSLALHANGRFTFQSDRAEPIGEIEIVRFRVQAPPVSHAAIWHQGRLAHGEVLLVELQKLDAAQLHVRTPWIDALDIPRTAIERITHEPGWQPTFFDSFVGDLAGWKTLGDARAERGSLLLTAGQSAETKLKSALVAGRVSVGFCGEIAKSLHLWLRLTFVRDAKPSTVRIELIGPGERFVVESAAKAEVDAQVKRIAGFQQFTAEFDRERLQLFINDRVLWSKAVGTGELESIALIAEGTGSETGAIEHVIIARPARTTVARTWADLTADAIRSPDDDESFGTLALSTNGLLLETKPRKRSVPWVDVNEFTFRRGTVAEKPIAGEHVRLRIRSVENNRDVLDGVVKSLDVKTLVLNHAVLGELSIPRTRIEEIRLRYHGRQLPVDTAPHHLGNRPAFGFAMPKPEGIRFSKTVRVDVIPSAAFLVIDAASIDPRGTPIEVLWNGDSIGELNRLADRIEPIVRQYRLPIECKRGNNELEVRLRPTEAGGRVTGIDLRAVRLELHDPR